MGNNENIWQSDSDDGTEDECNYIHDDHCDYNYGDDDDDETEYLLDDNYPVSIFLLK